MSQAEPMETIQEPKPQTGGQQQPLTRVRLTYARREALRYTSHLDLHLVWERTLRRASVPLAYSQGFNPRPRLHLASALPLGFLSRCEIADFWLNQPEEVIRVTFLALVKDIQKAAPPGLEILQGEIVPLSLPALQTQVHSAEYLAYALDPLDENTLREKVEQLLQAASLPRERRGKPYDLRPLIQVLEVSAGSPNGLFMRLTAREGATGRPEEVLDAMGFDPLAFRVERTALLLE